MPLLYYAIIIISHVQNCSFTRSQNNATILHIILGVQCAANMRIQHLTFKISTKSKP